MMVEFLTGNLVSKLGLEQGVAVAIVGLLSTSGAAAVTALYPFLAPFVLTLRGVLAVAGTAAAVGW